MSVVSGLVEALTAVMYYAAASTALNVLLSLLVLWKILGYFFG